MIISCCCEVAPVTFSVSPPMLTSTVRPVREAHLRITASTARSPSRFPSWTSSQSASVPSPFAPRRPPRRGERATEAASAAIGGRLDVMAGASRGTSPDARHGRRWDVALSFAGAQRDYVGQVAQALKARGVRCFYDADEQIELWGKYPADDLPAIYGQ